jgi:hypothetical protein
MECAKVGKVPSDDGNTCVKVVGDSLELKVYNDVADAPKCVKETSGMIVNTVRRGIVRCLDLKWQPATSPALGSVAANPLKDCAEAKTEYYVKDKVTVGQYFVKSGNQVNFVFCDLATAKKIIPGQDKAVPGNSCAEILKLGGTTTGMYWIDPDGAGAINVFCDQTNNGGGWYVMFANCLFVRWGFFSKILSVVTKTIVMWWSLRQSEVFFVLAVCPQCHAHTSPS